MNNSPGTFLLLLALLLSPVKTTVILSGELHGVEGTRTYS